jgi:DNA invertase Pin-like site-specific DNA recombinase
MNLPAPTSAASTPRRSARERELRRGRILERVQGGFSYAEIARQEGLSRERVRQIIAKSLQHDGGTPVDHALVQLARLEPALRLAADRVAAGDVKAIDRLLKVLERLDKYGPRVQVDAETSAELHARLMAKLNGAFAQMDRQAAAKQAAEGDAPAAAPAGVAEGAPGEASPSKKS